MIKHWMPFLLCVITSKRTKTFLYENSLYEYSATQYTILSTIWDFAPGFAPGQNPVTPKNPESRGKIFPGILGTLD